MTNQLVIVMQYDELQKLISNSDNFSLLFTVGGFISDNDGMIDDIDRFQDANDQYDAAVLGADPVATAAAADEMLLIADDLSGKVIAPELSGALAIGLTPKVVNVEAVDYSESISTVNTGLNDLIDNHIQDLGDFKTLDIGMVMGLTDNIQLGLTAKNLITEEITYGPDILLFDTELKAGIAYSGDVLTVGVDLDLTENDSVLSGGLKRQNLSLGLELYAFDFAQLRLGMIKNIADGIPDEAKKAIYTAGVGFWLVSI